VAEPLLSLEGLYKRYGSLLAAEGISFALERGIVHGLVGPAGSGKSTIAGLVSGTLLPDRGTITFRGESIERKSAGERARMGIVLAAGSAAMFPDETVLDNVRIACEAVRREVGAIFGRTTEATDLAAWRVLAVTNLKTRSQLRASSLGFIDRRWLEIAMALVCEPQVIVFDEPFAGATAGEIQEIGDFVLKLKPKHALLVTDRSAKRMAAFGGPVTVLTRGHDAATGSPAETSSVAEPVA
jgi:branched-chain amino acid transport system ATP-binding protein